MEKHPKVTVVTVVHNAQDVIESTIKSVKNQSYSNIEYIIVDGGSKDKTVSVVEKYMDDVDIFISEPDKGIYDAMNKGILLATGDWINFMNAGDVFVDDIVCNDIFSDGSYNDNSIIYGDTYVDNPATGKIVKGKVRSFSNITKGMIFSHQSAFIKSSVAKANLFDLRFKIVADYYQMLSLHRKNAKFFYYKKPISKVTIDGLSYSNVETTIESFKVIRELKCSSFGDYCFLTQRIVVAYFRILLGKRLTSKMRMIKWKLLKKQ